MENTFKKKKHWYMSIFKYINMLDIKQQKYSKRYQKSKQKKIVKEK